MKILLDYVFPITAITPTPAASTAFLKQVGLVCKPNGGGTDGDVTLCTSAAEVLEVTANTNATQLFAAGLSRVYIIQSDDLDLADILAENANLFYTILVSDDYTDADVTLAKADGTVTITSYANLVSGTDDVVTIEGVAFTAQTGAATLGTTTFQAATDNATTAASLVAQINAHTATSALVVAAAVGAVVTITAKDFGTAGNTIGLSYTDNDTNVGLTLGGLSGGNLAGGAGLLLGDFDAVVGVSSDDEDFLEDQAVIEQRCAFLTNASNGATNMCYAFGKLLSNASNWLNQQYVSMPVSDDVEALGDAELYFDNRFSFVISDDEFGDRLGLFVAGGKAITAPYILKNLRIDMQSAALTYISGNQPKYTIKEASLLENRLNEDVIKEYIALEWITDGIVQVSLVEDNFVANGEINVSEPKALWRVVSEMRQTL